MNDIAGPGHNLPNEFDALTGRTEELVKNANAWAAKHQEIADEDTAGRCSDFLQQVTDELKAAKAGMAAEKKPHQDAIKEIGGRYDKLVKRLETIKAVLNPLRTAWLLKKKAEQEEAARKAAEEAERIKAEAERKRREAEEAARAAAEQARLQAEQAAREAEAREGDVIGAQIRKQEAEKAAKEAEKAAKKTVKEAAKEEKKTTRAAAQAANRAARAKPQVRGDLGTRAAGLRPTYSAEIVNYDLVLWGFRNHPDIKEAVETLANAYARKPGAKDIKAKDGKVILRVIETMTAA